MKPQTVLMLGGPTASGKSALALALASHLGGWVINADALQVYRDLRIVSARPNAAEEAEAPHRLYGVMDGTERCSAALWRGMALEQINAARLAGAVPILVGGTGLYFRALSEGLADIPDVPAEIRLMAMERAAAEGVPALHRDLTALDPVLAARLDPTDLQRVVRGWEVVTATGTPLSTWQAAPRIPPPDHLYFVSIRLMPERTWLYERCDARLQQMVENGALDELKILADRQLEATLPVMKAVGVPDLLSHLIGGTPLETAISKAQQATRRYAKRQLTWFRNQWSNADVTLSEIDVSQKLVAQLSESLRFQ